MNKYNRNKGNHKGLPQRKSIRLKGYDYSQAGLYFITICCQHRACLFGDVVDGKMILNAAGTMINTEWLKLPERFKNIELHEYVIMPNHFHGILEIVAATVGATLVVALNETVAQNYGITQNQIGQPQGIAPTKTIGDMMDAFKSITTVEYIRGVKTLNWQPFVGKLWQRNYWEHIIRNEQSYQRISKYIINNPSKWSDDKFFPV
ncbi:transposase [Algoriphagus yeomjeoni]|nr:transposase [Algoriphagus yeomjeoni]